MKTLSIRQPYATLIAEGIKDIENRSFKTNFRGTFLIHASGLWHERLKTGELFTNDQFNKIADHQAKKIFDENQKFLGTFRYLGAKDCENPLPVGAIIGKAKLVDCVMNHDSIWAEKDSEINRNDLDAKNIWNWVLEDAILFDEPFFNVKGKLSFWDYNI